MSMDCYALLKCFIVYSLIWLARADEFVNSSARKLSYDYNPGCQTPEYKSFCSNATGLNLIHVRADGSDDTLHYLWSTWKLPTVIIARTSHSSNLSVNWQDLYNFGMRAVSFSETPLYSVGFVVKEVWEFNDPEDKVNMNLSPSAPIPLNLSTCEWGGINETIKVTESLITAFSKASNSERAFSKSGSFGVKFSTAADNRASSDFPHLVFTGNSSQVQVILDNLVTENLKSRFAVELVALSTDVDNAKEWNTYYEKSISDEFSPGVFKFLRLKAPCSEKSPHCKGVMSWKPVAYIGQTPSVANSSDAAISHLNTTSLLVTDSIATSYFEGVNNVSQVVWIMTFGTSGDGFYSKTGYTSWSMMIGIGESVTQGLSKTATLVIGIGLGVPLALMVIATIYLGVTQCRRKEDELLLSQDSMN